MVLTPVNDPALVPPHWTGVIRPGQFAIFVFDARTHGARNPDGVPPEGGESRIAICADLTEATDFSRRLVAAHPAWCCEIYDHNGEYGQPRTTIYDDAWHEKHLGRGLAKRRTIGGVLCLMLGVSLVIIDLRRDLAWFWGYILGIKFLIIGTTLLLNGVLGLRNAVQRPG